MSTSRAALEQHAPDAARILDLVAGLPLPPVADAAVAEFADQFALDVASLDAAQRSAFFTATGDQAFPVVQQVYAHDFAPRVRAVLETVLGPGDWPEVQAGSTDGDSWALLESFMTAVARLRVLDARTTELVRLRGARLHHCAVCMSRRSQDAYDAGARDEDFTALDAWEQAPFDPATRAALGLVDALVRTPFAVPAEVVRAAQQDLEEAEVVEVVLDVMRNAANKIAVALGADAATVTDGVELFTTDADGTLSVVGTA